MKKETRTQYTLDQKKSFITQADALVAGGMQLKDAAKKLGINDAYIHTWKRTFKKQGVKLDAAPTIARNGAVIPSLEKKQAWINQVDELRKRNFYMHERFLRIKEVLQRTGYSRSTIYKLVAEGGFPKQVKIGLRAAAWPESSIDRWIDEKICPVVHPKICKCFNST